MIEYARSQYWPLSMVASSAVYCIFVFEWPYLRRTGHTNSLVGGLTFNSMWPNKSSTPPPSVALGIGDFIVTRLFVQ